MKGTRDRSRNLRAWLASIAVRGLSQRTLQHARQAVRQFAAWLARKGRLPADPLASVDGYAPSRDRRYERGAYTDDEVRALCTDERIPLWRRAFYALASCTGLRCSECLRLRREWFDLEAATVRTAADATKGRRKGLLPITRSCADLLRSYWQILDAGGRTRARARGRHVRSGRARLVLDLARALPEGAPEKWLSRDQALLGIPRTRGGLHLDLHALRGWHATTIARDAGLDPLALAAITRHRDPRTTLASYYHLDESQAERVREAIEGSTSTASRRRRRT